MNVWLLTNTPSPYQVEFLSAIQRTGRCSLEVRFMRQVHRGELWQPAGDPGFRFRVPRGIGPSTWSDAFRLHPSAIAECLTGRFDRYVLSGQYTSLTFVACSMLLHARRKPCVLWLERPWPEDYRPEWTRSVAARSPAASAARRRILSGLLRRATRIFGIGSAAVEAYRALGADPRRLVSIPYHCDTSRFAAADPRDVEEIARRHALAGKTVFLFSGQLIERKAVDVLLRAFEELAASRPDAALLVLGDGPLRQRLESSVAPACRNRVHFAGHVPQEKLPSYFHAADVFVLPSRHDGWGVVINEACGAGLPVIAADTVSAARDLVADGRNGFLVPRDDVGRLREKMAALAGDEGMRRRFGGESRRMAEQCSLGAGAAAFCKHLEEAGENP